MSDIFVSHIHEEEKVAKALVKFVKQQLGSSTEAFVSSDSWQLYAGEIWLDRIREELASAKVVILLLSSESVKRPWVNFEAGAAWLTKKVIIPVCFGGLDKAVLPKPYSNIQALDLESEYYYLVRSINHHLGHKTLTPPPCRDSDFDEVKSALESLKNNMPTNELEQEVRILVDQADRLIRQLGVDVSKAATSSMYSDAFRQIFHAYERLAEARKQLIEQAVLWERETVDGRNGEELMRRLWCVREKLRDEKQW
jgi:hypothetical protein